MTSGEAVTAVIPAYNRAHLLPRAIESVLAQTSPPREVIVVDDGSTDDTSAVVSSYGGRVRYVHQTNAGGAAARNRGVGEANTEWIAFLDSDDVWLPNHLASVGAAMEATDERGDLYFADVARTTEEGGGTTFGRAGLEFESPHLLVSDATRWAVAERQPAMIQGMVIRRGVFEELGGFWPELSSRHDTHFFYFALVGRAACAVAGPTVQMTADESVTNRLTGGTGNRGQRFWRCTIRLYQDVLERRSNPHERTVARSLLARGFKRLARAQWSDGERLASARSMALALRTAPVDVVLSMVPGNRRAPAVAAARRALAA